jgi:HNH endonuclease
VKWPDLLGRTRKQPDVGRWHQWKEVIAEHCAGVCIYCAIPEGRFGGIRNFHVEHFRPKSKFSHLEDDITNLYLACAICNVLKSDDWPGEPTPDHSLPVYPDPGVTNYNSLFVVSPQSYEVSASTLAGKYLIERILLNRAQLILERRLATMLRSLAEFEDWAERSLSDMNPSELRDTSAVLLQISRTKTSTLLARPYRDADAKRPPKAKLRK